MATSKSREGETPAVAGARLFSGRSDPTWPVDEEVVARVEEIWTRLEPWEGQIPPGPPLGYRGSFLKLADGSELRAYQGLVTLGKAGREESRRDRDGAIERLLLDSAPQGALPALD
jgi:hypothetical protein